MQITKDAMLFKRGASLFFILLFSAFLSAILSLSFAGAISASISSVNSTLTTASVSSATNLYGYELNFSYTGSVSISGSSYGFLGSGTSYGSTTRGGYLYVYESRVDSTQTGITGSGSLFNVTFTGDLSICGLLAVYADGSEEHVSYCGGSSGGGSSGSGSGGGGGGSSAVGTTTATAAEARSSVSVAPGTLSVRAILNRDTPAKILLVNNGTKRAVLRLSSERLSGVLSFPESVILAAGESKEIEISILTTERGILTGIMAFSVGGEIFAELPITINVRSENFLFDTILTLADRYRVINPGQKLTVQINLQEAGVQSDKVDVVASYIIKDFSGQSYLEESETFFVLHQKEYVKEFATQNLPVGEYVLGLELIYPGAFATSSVQFEVAPSQPVSFVFLVSFIFVILLVFVVVWFWATRRRNLLHPSNAVRKPRRIR